MMWNLDYKILQVHSFKSNKNIIVPNADSGSMLIQNKKLIEKSFWINMLGLKRITQEVWWQNLKNGKGPAWMRGSQKWQWKWQIVT